MLDKSTQAIRKELRALHDVIMAPYREQRRDKARAAANIGVKKRRLAIAAKDGLRSAREAPREADAVKVEEEWEEEDCRERLSYKRRGLRSGWAQVRR
ncbi:hypothetical protein LOZ58_004900 [Ophidiomyces ophidiicola]|nr:hypothetical protein LOZ65_004266 [Ophidiomyces ophidiicola]KAI1958863.1 hypothetical protein LOZ58_004900 [Ophidiomyces ophidiicola]